MLLVQLNAAGKDLAPPLSLDQSGLRLPQVLARHVDRSRPFMVAIRRKGDHNSSLNELWVTRGWKVEPIRDEHNKVVTPGIVNPWPRRYIGKGATVVVVYLPQGGGGSAAGGGSRSKSPLAIVAGIAGLALAAFAGPLAGLLAPTLAGALGVSVGVATFATQALFVLGGTALLAFSSKSRASKTATDSRELYGISGGGNLAKTGETIPRAYGRTWVKGDLSQPDFSKYDGDEQILFKRITLTVGRGRAYQVRAGAQLMWTEANGFLPPFNDARNAIEFIYGTPSALVPSNVISAAGVGGTLPRPTDNPAVAGPFNVNQRGALITKIEISFQFPNGISRQTTLKSGTVLSSQPAAWAVYFEYAAIDESGAVVGPWQVLYNGNSGLEGARFGTKPMRYTKAIDVPAGRYAIRGRNIQPDTSENTSTGDRIIDAAQWDSAVGYVADTAVRPGITECCLVVYAGKGNQAAAFGEIEVDLQAVIPVYVGNQWVLQETSKAVWAYCDILRDPDYGAGLSDSATLGARDRAVFYANALTEFDTFDAVIRGPVSVYEAGATALLTMRGEPVYLGRFWSLVRDEPRAVRRHIITPRQITASSTREMFDLDTESGKNHVIGEFDQDGDYRRPGQTQAIYGEASRTPVRQRWTGVKTYEHAQHLTRWRAASGAYRTLTKEFGVELEGRIYKRGDSIAVVTWFLDTNKTAQVVQSSGSTLTLDADIAVTGGDQVVLRDRAGREWGPVALIGNGTSLRELKLDAASVFQTEIQTGQTLAQTLSDDDTEMTAVSVGQIAYLSENFLVQSVSMSGEDRATVSVIFDAPEVFEQIGAPILTPPDGIGGLTDPEVPKIVAFTANRVQAAAGFLCQYAITPGRGCVLFDVEISYDGMNHYDAVQEMTAALSGSFALNPVDPTKVTLRARPYGGTGLPGLWFYAEINLPRSEVGVVLPLIDYVDFSADVKARVDHILEVEARGEQIALQAHADFVSALGRADDAFGRAEDALARALESLGNDTANTAAITAEANTRLTADEATTSQLNIAVSRIDGNTAAIISEASTRSTADESTTNQLNVAFSQIGTNIAAITEEKSTRATADSLQAQKTTSLIAQTDSDRAYFLSEQQVRIDQDGLFASNLENLGVKTDGYRADFLSEQRVRISNDSAQADTIEGVRVRVGANESSIIDERSVRADADTIQANRTSTLLLQTDSDRAYFLSEQQARIANDDLFASNLTVLSLQTDSDRAAFLAEQQVRINTDGSLATDISALYVQTGSNVAAINDERTARTTAEGAFAQTLTDVRAESAAGTASGRFSLQAVSAPSGVSLRLQALLASQQGGQTYGAGYYLDLLGDGTSRFVIDATAFYITSNGSSIPLLSFDGFTLTIPSLRVTNSVFLPNAVSQTQFAASTDNNNFASITITTRGNAKVQIVGIFDGAPMTALPINGAGVIRIERDGSPIRDTFVNFYIAGNNDNRGAYTLQTTTIYCDTPPAGQHTYTVRVLNGQKGVAIQVQELAA